MSKRGLLLCNLARQGINASSSEKQELSKEDQSEISKKDCEMVPQQDNSKHNENLDENDFRLLQWLNDNQRIDYVEETLENLKNISENDEETTKELKEKTHNIEETIDTFKEATDNVKEIINCDTGGNTTGETSQLRQDNATTGSESDGSDFSGTDTDSYCYSNCYVNFRIY